MKASSFGVKRSKVKVRARPRAQRMRRVNVLIFDVLNFMRVFRNLAYVSFLRIFPFVFCNIKFYSQLFCINLTPYSSVKTT